MARIDSFLELVTAQQASDLHFCSGARPTIRHDGELVALPFRQLRDREARRFLYEILSSTQRDQFRRLQEIDFVYALPGHGRFRANYFEQIHGIGAVFRIIPDSIPLLADLDMPLAVNRLLDFANGLILITGPTGSGKSTTMAALINELNRNHKRHIISIEDPIEYLHEDQQSIITQRQVGVHADSFASALRAALRESPDVIVVGEMRDAETINLALSAAETGSLVLGTLHTNSAATSIDRIIESTADRSREQIRATLSVLVKGVLSQNLLRRKTGDGRVAVCELLIHNHAVANMIREDKIYQIDAALASADGRGNGNLGYDMSLYQLVRRGLIEVEDALAAARVPENLERHLQHLPVE